METPLKSQVATRAFRNVCATQAPSPPFASSSTLATRFMQQDYSLLKSHKLTLRFDDSFHYTHFAAGPD